MMDNVAPWESHSRTDFNPLGPCGCNKEKKAFDGVKSPARFA